jgi:mono/diheme cytochrome c family protein
MSRGLLPIIAIIVLAAAAAGSARAADAGKGKRLAEEHCATCHAVTPQGSGVVADSPPFEVIARKYHYDAGMIAAAIAGPHPKMNFAPGAKTAADIAAYIATLRQ